MNLTGTPIIVGSVCTTIPFDNATNSDYWNGAAGCNATDNDCIWGWFTAISTSTTITYVTSTPTINPIITVFTANCATNMASVACSDASATLTETLTFATVVNQAYKIRIAANGVNTDFNGTICVFSAVAVPQAGNDPCSATTLTPGGTCFDNWYSNSTATNTAGPPAPLCAAYVAENDVWFQVTMPVSGNIQIDTDEGDMTNSGMAVYSAATCAGPFTLISCDADASANGNMSLLTITQAQIPAGSTVWIRLWAEASNNGAFGICVTRLTACGNPLGLLNDNCETPATLTACATCSFSATTISYSPDFTTIESDQSGPFCGSSIDNNSWYQFTASGTTADFPFTSYGAGCIQTLVMEVTHNASGCCTGFTIKGECVNTINATNSTLNATGLTAGNTYVLMIDGQSGAQCDFTISGWSGTGILPIELLAFNGIEFLDRNVISWKTASEINNDYFNLYRSFDGENFEIVTTMDGAGNSTQLLNYYYPDYDIRFGTMYYQLEQVDFDGQSTKSNIIALNRKSSEFGVVSVYPNPTQNSITIDINTATNEGGLVYIEAVNGDLIYEQTIEGKGIHQLTYDMSNLSAGMYFVKYYDSEVFSVKQLIKN